MTRQGSALTNRLCGAASLRPGGTTEEQRWGRPGPSWAEWWSRGGRAPSRRPGRGERAGMPCGRAGRGWTVEEWGSSGVVGEHGLRGPTLLPRKKQGLRRRGLHDLRGVKDHRPKRGERLTVDHLLGLSLRGGPSPLGQPRAGAAPRMRLAAA